MAILLVGEVVNSCDSAEGWFTPKDKKPKKEKGAGPATASFQE